MGTLTVNATNGQTVEAGANYTVPLPAGKSLGNYQTAGATITTRDGSVYPVTVSFGASGITVTNPTGRDIASGGFDFIDLQTSGILARFNAAGETEVLIGPKNTEAGLVTATVDPVSGEKSIALGSTQKVLSGIINNEFTFLPLGLKIGGHPNVGLYDARMLPNGNILFCCGRDTDVNSDTQGVAEVDPSTGEIVWSYQDLANWVAGSAPETAYKLANGNYLISAVDATVDPINTDGIYEMTPDYVKVWGIRGARYNRIRPAYIDGRDVVICFGGAVSTNVHKVSVVDLGTHEVIWEMDQIGVGLGDEQHVNGGDHRKINGVNYLLATLWQANPASVALINYDTKTIINRTATGQLATYGPVDAQWLSDTIALVATGGGIGSQNNGLFQLIRPFDNCIIASLQMTTSKTQCCNYDHKTGLVMWVTATEIFCTDLNSLNGWVPASKTVTFTGASPLISYTGTDIFAIDDPVVFTNSGGALPAALVSGTTYYVKARDTTGKTIQVCATLPSATAAVITPATAGTPTHTCTSGLLLARSRLRKVTEKITSRRGTIFSGYSKKNGAVNALNGLIQIGENTANCGYLDFNNNDGNVYLSNSANSSTGNVILSTKEAATAVKALEAYGLGVVRLSPGYLVANLTDSAILDGCHAYVTDATMTLTAGIGTIVVGGGVNHVPVFYNGADWLIG